MKKEKENKKGRGKKALKVLCIIVAVILVLGVVCTAVSAIGQKSNLQLAASFGAAEYEEQLVPERDGDGNVVFTTDKEFKVVQLTDIHLGGGFMSINRDSCALTAVSAMLKAEKPDLVIATGDIAYPVPFQAGTFNNKNGAHLFAELMEDLGIYWTLGFGNHDTESYSFYTREDIASFYMNSGYEHCLLTTGPDDIDGVGNQLIKVQNSKGVVTQALFVLDSHSYQEGDKLGIAWKYDNIHENQIEWYRSSIKSLNDYNRSVLAKGGNNKADKKAAKDETVKSLLFFHIPLREYADAWKEFSQNGYKDTENVKYIEGCAGEKEETVYCGVGEDDLFETVCELGSTKAIFCGHDHLNNFSLNYKGIDLIYGNSIDYLAYIGIPKQGSQRGCTVITIAPDGSYKIEKNNLYSGKYELPEGFSDKVSFQFDEEAFAYSK